jgi:hypothetical protein
VRIRLLKPVTVATLVGRDPLGALRPSLDDTLRRLPRDVGLVLLSLGVAGLVIPGPVPPGVPFVVAGVVFAYPGVARRFGGSFSRRFPRLYCGFHDQVKRFQSDLEARYPGSTRPR